MPQMQRRQHTHLLRPLQRNLNSSTRPLHTNSCFSCLLQDFAAISAG
jgi:hypothetical protein